MLLLVYAVIGLAWMAAAAGVSRLTTANAARACATAWESLAPLIAGVVVLTALLMTAEQGAFASPGYAELVRIVLVAVVSAVVIEWRFTGAGISAVALLPALAVAITVHGALPASWPADILVLVALALACAVYAVWRGRGAYALAAVAFSVVAPAVGPPGGRLESFVAIVAVIALLWLVVSRLLDGRTFASAADASAAWEVGGIVVLTAASVAVPLVTQSIPLLSGNAVTGWHAFLGGAMPLAWLLAFVLRPRREYAWVVYGTSGYAVAALLAFAAPAWPSARYAAVLLLFAIAWSQAEPLPQRLLGLENESVAQLSQALLAGIPVLGLVGSLAGTGTVRSWDAVALLGAAAVAWLLEGIRRGRSYEFAAAAGLAVAFAADAAATGLAVSAAPAAAALAALVLAGVVMMLPAGRPKGAVSALVGGVVATALLPLAFGASGDLALALFLDAAAWAAVAVAAEIPELALATGLLGSASGFAALARFHSPPAGTIAFAAGAAALLLVPTALVDRTSAEAPSTRVARVLAASGCVDLLLLLGFGLASGLSEPGSSWTAIGWQGQAWSLVFLGGYVLVWAALEDVEVGIYVGIGLFVWAYWVVLMGVHVETAEFYLVAAAIYSVAMGYLWASRGQDREVPQLTDVTAVMLGVVAPFLLSVTSFDPSASFRHGLWALGLATLAILAGLALRVRVHFLAGLAVAALDSLWLSRDWLFALPKWLVIGTVGVVLIAVGLGYARRQAMMGEAAERMRDALADWR